MGIACRICNNDENNKHHLVREMHFGTREEFDYLECSRCGCLQISQIPSDMEKYYCGGYYSLRALEGAAITARIHHVLKKERSKYLLTKQGVLGRILFRFYPTDMPFDRITRIDNARNKSILDVGSGSGDFLYQLREMGFRNLIGIDPYIDRDLHYRNGLVIIKKSLHDYKRESGRRFDIIMFNHSFEHMSDPQAVLNSAADLLEVDGCVMVRIPIVSSYAWERYGTDWVQIDAPRHLYLHSLRSFSLLAEQARLAITDVVYDSTELQFWGSEQYKRDIPFLSPDSYRCSARRSIFKRREIEEFGKRAVELNLQKLGDQAAFYLEKPGKD
jgi:SAM-dependent methyltransferase